MNLQKMYIDTHCHLDRLPQCQEIVRLINQLAACKVNKLVIPGVVARDWQGLFSLQQQYPQQLFPALGLHPCFVDSHQKADIDQLEQLLVSQKSVALGEIGLDFWQASPDKQQQTHYFSAQIDLAKNFKLPVIIHCRKAHDECAKLLRAVGFAEGGIIHAFSGSVQQAERYLDLGFKLGVGGAVTYERARKLRKTISKLPLESLVLETDAPDMAPAFIDKLQPNSPVYLPLISQVLAAILDIPEPVLAEQCWHNAHQVLPGLIN